jgi:hypothetical protein
MPLETIVDTSDSDVGLKCSVAKGLREKMHAAAVQATQEVFSEEILPAAKEGSPVLTGKNRDSIAVSFRDRLETGWVSAWLFTQSGYGWLIEHGTSSRLQRGFTRTRKSKRIFSPSLDRTPAKPYLYPAVMRFVNRIPERMKEILEENF